MLGKIVNTTETVLLIGGGTVDPKQLDACTALAGPIVCADGGANVAIDHGLVPDYVIGDMDSIHDHARAKLSNDQLVPIAEQDSTDFDKCMRHVQTPLILGVGFEGDRLDHMLAAYNILVRRCDQRCILVGSDQIVFLAPPELSIDLPVGSLFSLFPMDAVTGMSQGLKWPLEGLHFAPAGQVGTSNEVSGPVTLTLHGPSMLVILPVTALRAVMSGLSAAPAQWLARAE